MAEEYKMDPKMKMVPPDTNDEIIMGPDMGEDDVSSPWWTRGYRKL